MSALTQFTDQAAFKSAKARISALQDAIGFNTRDFSAEQSAAQNLANGLPAFGWTNTYSNAPAGELVSAINRLGGIEAGQDDLRAHFARNGRDVTDECWLDNLLPLNKSAVMDLMRAYQNVGTFRSPDELRRRTERREQFVSAVLQAAE